MTVHIDLCGQLTSVSANEIARDMPLAEAHRKRRLGLPEPRRPAQSDRLLPLTDHIAESLLQAVDVSTHLMHAGCLIRNLTVDEEGVSVLLHRTPPARLLQQMSPPQQVSRFIAGRQRWMLRSTYRQASILWRAPQ